ncbi:hypothetical protein CN378_12960 [Bacillus sp. AFS015802]|uniref:DUF6843 domain-containing protein n=1 Tax=Bacillus sp. AFS015802 TaxID=2033486 RepID=UPI000BF3F048|nr:hypothetical protein [Bacillus sp. AFS015802]PFA66802.1 hypothetical protein CN378_12960 [Bacillus sp. AFS015802]
MKKMTIWGLIIISILVSWYWLEKNKPYDEVFMIPKGYKGCVNVVYEIQGVPPLEVKDHSIQYKVDHDGILLTSSPPDFGWEGKESSGLHDIEYFYIDEEGAKTKEIPEDKIGPTVLGEHSENGKILSKRLTFSVNNKGASCDQNFEELEKKVNEKLRVD